MPTCKTCGHDAAAHDCGGTECWANIITGNRIPAITPLKCDCPRYEETNNDRS